MVEQLANERIQRFLAGKQVVVLATVQPDGAPLAMPMWFLLGGDRLTMVTIAGTQKVQNLRRDPRCCVVAETGTRADIRGVTVQGRAEFVPDWADRRSLVERLLERYSPELEHRWGGHTMPADRVLFHIVPHEVRSWGLPA
ncbi:MAG: pyridoxamine 5'-phosphate oxidase family protein [Candidatus Rokuibacteriota bacterium]